MTTRKRIDIEEMGQIKLRIPYPWLRDNIGMEISMLILLSGIFYFIELHWMNIIYCWMSSIFVYYIFILQYTAKDFYVSNENIYIRYKANFFLSDLCYRISDISKINFNGNSTSYGAAFFRIHLAEGKSKKFHVLRIII